MVLHVRSDRDEKGCSPVFSQRFRVTTSAQESTSAQNWLSPPFHTRAFACRSYSNEHHEWAQTLEIGPRCTCWQHAQICEIGPRCTCWQHAPAHGPSSQMHLLAGCFNPAACFNPLLLRGISMQTNVLSQSMAPSSEMYLSAPPRRKARSKTRRAFLSTTTTLSRDR